MFLSPEIVINAYYKGLFPMADSINDPYIFWVNPAERGIIKISDFRDKGIIKNKEMIKILGHGEIKKAINIEVNSISSSARSKIEKAGGKISIIKKYKDMNFIFGCLNAETKTYIA